jgi:hypothetical protein
VPPLTVDAVPSGTLATVAVGEAPGPICSPLLRALRGEPVEHVPVWFMRQAGRSLPEYRAVRQRATLLEITHAPEFAAEVTLQPVRRHGVLHAAPLHGRVFRFERALPQYTVGHLERVARIDAELARLPTVRVSGAAYRGVGVAACIGDGQAAADRVLAALAGAPRLVERDGASAAA